MGIEPTWDIEVEDVHEFALDNGCVSHNTSSLALSFTESAEPIRALKINKEGTYTLPFLAPNLTRNRPYYETCWQVDNKTLIKLAAIRQKFVDQSQSTNIYFEKIESAFELLEVIMLAEKLGIKSLYYLNTAKAGEVEPPCENCSV
jgi:ribonucleoside-diphosphate reductase alpha chain